MRGSSSSAASSSAAAAAAWAGVWAGVEGWVGVREEVGVGVGEAGAGGGDGEAGAGVGVGDGEEVGWMVIFFFFRGETFFVCFEVWGWVEAWAEVREEVEERGAPSRDLRTLSMEEVGTA